MVDTTDLKFVEETHAGSIPASGTMEIDMKSFKRNKCPWKELKETDQGILFWCEKCGAIFNEEGTWKNNGPIMPSAANLKEIPCPDMKNKRA